MRCGRNNKYQGRADRFTVSKYLTYYEMDCKPNVVLLVFLIGY